MALLHSDEPFSELNDETLILLTRYGLPKPRDILLMRYFAQRRYHARMACPKLYTVLDDGELNEVSFRTFLSALTNYRFGATRFSTYYQTCIGRQVSKAAIAKLRRRHREAYSLDDPYYEEDNGVSLKDSVPTNILSDNPSAVFDYAETVYELLGPREGVNQKMLDVASRAQSGYTIEEIAQELHISKRSCESYLFRYRRWARALLHQKEEEEQE